MASKCAMCGKKIGFGTKYYFFDTDLELCVSCSNNADILLAKLDNASHSNDLDQRYNEVISKIQDNDKLTEEHKKIMIDKYHELYLPKKNMHLNIELNNKINVIEKGRKQQVNTQFDSMNQIIDNRKNYTDISSIMEINDLYEYDIIVIQDKSDGSTNIEQLQETIENHSVLGWRLKTMINNELGKNMLSISAGGAGGGTNSTIDQLVLIFERRIHKANY